MDTGHVRYSLLESDPCLGIIVRSPTSNYSVLYVRILYSIQIVNIEDSLYAEVGMVKSNGKVKA